MDHHSQQADFWKGTFGKEYTDRCTVEEQEEDSLYISQFGKTKLEMYGVELQWYAIEKAKTLTQGINFIR